VFQTPERSVVMPTRIVRRGAALAALLLVAFIIGVVGAAAAPAEAQAAEGYTSFYVYFPLYLQTGASVYPVRYLVPTTPTPALASMQALIGGLPGNGGLRLIALPKDTTVKVSIKDGNCTVDFSEEIRKVNVGSGGEAAVISAIVTTLGQFQGVKTVTILVGGKPVETLAGHVDITGPLSTEDRPVFQVLKDVYQHWSGGAVAALQVMDVISGYEDGTFGPETQVSRAEFIKMLTEGLRLPDAASQAIPFKDVQGLWHASYVQRALAAGLIKASDYGDYLKPDEIIPREEMANLLVTASAAYLKDHPEVQYPAPASVPFFSDLASTQERYRAAVQESARLGLLLGFPDGTFRPKEGLKRSEAATVITRVLGMAGTKDIVRVSPLTGAKWDGGSINVLGAAQAFEGNVNWRLKSATGEDIMYGYTTASMGMGWGVFGLHIDAALFAGKTPKLLDVFLVSMMDGSEYSNVVLPLDTK
jgi:hypothetical protein